MSTAIAVACAGHAAGTRTHLYQSTDRGLCPFPLQIAVSSPSVSRRVRDAALQFTLLDPSTVTLRNAATGRMAMLGAGGSYSISRSTGGVRFSGRMFWFSANGKHIPFLSTSGSGKLAAPLFLLSPPHVAARTIDPCALVATVPPATLPRRTPAPWPLPRFPLSQIGYAGLVPIVGTLVRHDHVHLDVLVDGRKVEVPAGVGMAQPIDTGPCVPGPPVTGDCRTGNIYVGEVATSPIHTHSTSGIIHIEADRKAVYTLGEFFDEWGVRLTSRCLGSYCAGNGRELRAYVDGKLVSGSPRAIVLGNHQEIAVVFGPARDFRSVPRSYGGGWPGVGCGGAGEHSCLP